MQNAIAKLRIPPQNIDAEIALLGSIMLRPEAMYEVTDVVKAHSFYAEKHRIIFRAMLDLFSKATPIDLLSLTTRLQETKYLDQVGGASYLTELTNSVPSAANARHYAEIVHKKFVMRSLIEASEAISAIGFSDTEEVNEALDKAEKSIFEISNASVTHKFVELKDTLAEAFERYEHLHRSKDEMRGVPTGFRQLDNILAGFHKSDLIILAARPSVGKTSLALDIVRNAAVKYNIPTGVFSLEMSTQQLVDRLLSAQSNIDAFKLRTGKNLSLEHDFQLISSALDTLSKAPIFIDDKPGNNILQMRSVARRLKKEKGLGLIVVDYLQLMTPTQTRSTDSTVQQVTEISRSLKQLARELEVPVLALSQLSRAVEQRGGEPRLSDLRDSGSIEQDADVVMFIHREDRGKDDSEKTGIAKILVQKHRNGPTGTVELRFNEKQSSFQELDTSNYGGADAEFAQF